MDLPNLFSNSEALISRLFLCTILTDTTLQSLLLKVTSSGTKILQRSLVYTYSEEKTAVVRMDESLQELGEESEKVNEIVFALEQSWMKDGSLINAKKSLLHSLVTDLALKPVGFVVQSEAIVQHSLNHNPHFSAIVLLLTQASVMVNIVSQGKVVSVQTVGRSSDTISDLKEAFARFLKEKDEAHLPGKLLCASFVLSESEIIQTQQKLLDADWTGIPFVQTPTIDVIKPELAASIIAEQAGQATHTDFEAGSATTPAIEKDGDNFGFTTIKTGDEETAVEGVSKTLLPTSFGIPISPKALPDDASEDAKIAVAEAELVEEDEEEESADSAKKGFSFGALFARFGKKKTNLDSAPEELAVQKPAHKHTGVPSGKHHKKYNPKPFIIGGVVAGILVLVGAAFVWITFFTQVTIAIKPVIKTVTKEVSLTLDPNLQTPDASTLHIPAKKVTVDVSKEESGATTGIKIVGEKATGEITIFNKMTSQKTFAAGTVVSIDKKQFVTDKEVTIEAATKKDGQNYETTITPSQGNVTVTAFVIGADGNIAKDTELSIATFDKNTYVAKANADFAGGASREVRVVSKEDKDGLLAQAKKDLIADAQTKFKEESGNGTYVIPTQDIAITKATYSAENEAPTDQLQVTVTATVTGLSYQVSDLVPIAQAVLADQVPDGYFLSDANPEILSAPPEEAPKNSSALTITANVSSQAEPKLDLNSLPGEVAGQSLDKAKEQLMGKKTISEVTFQFTPTFAASLSQALPKDKKKITFVTE